MIIRHPALERGSRALQSTAASLLAAGTLVGAPFLLFALAYKTYNLVVLGHWYVWGAPTPIGTCCGCARRPSICTSNARTRHALCPRCGCRRVHG